MEDNWRTGSHTLTRIQCHSENSKGVYCLQYDDEKIVSGLRDNTIKVRGNHLAPQLVHYKMIYSVHVLSVCVYVCVVCVTKLEMQYLENKPL